MSERDNVYSLPLPWPPLTRPRFTFEELRGRLGYFVIADKAIEIWPDTVMEVMGRCIVMQTGRCGYGDATLYLALSREFSRIGEDERPPFYEWRYEKGAMHAQRMRRDGD